MTSGTTALSEQGRTVTALERLRREAGLTRRELAVQSRLSERAIFALEREGVHASSATQTVLGAVFDVPREVLFPDA
jgi:DNA-binding XRE family transcriptional regulator